jgi:hypothetical protein
LFSATVAILSSVALILSAVYAMVNSLPDEDPSPPGADWTYNSKSGSLYFKTPNGDVHYEKMGEGRPCDEVKDEVGTNLTCNESDTTILP